MGFHSRIDAYGEVLRILSQGFGGVFTSRDSQRRWSPYLRHQLLYYRARSSLEKVNDTLEHHHNVFDTDPQGCATADIQECTIRIHESLPRETCLAARLREDRTETTIQTRAEIQAADEVEMGTT